MAACAPCPEGVRSSAGYADHAQTIEQPAFEFFFVREAQSENLTR
jgi:hypothetical protein